MQGSLGFTAGSELWKISLCLIIESRKTVIELNITARALHEKKNPKPSNQLIGIELKWRSTIHCRLVLDYTEIRHSKRSIKIFFINCS